MKNHRCVPRRLLAQDVHACHWSLEPVMRVALGMYQLDTGLLESTGLVADTYQSSEDICSSASQAETKADVLGTYGSPA